MTVEKTKFFDVAHRQKLKHLSREERAKAGIKKLAQELEANRNKVEEPPGLASGATDGEGKMMVDLDGNCDDEQ